MKKLLFVSAMLLLAVAAKSQSDKGQKNKKDDIVIDSPADNPGNSPAKPDENKIFYAVEVEPSFPGGQAAFIKYIYKRINHELLNQTDAPPKEIVTFVVERDGSLTDVKLLRGHSPVLDSAVIAIVKKSPKWNPGTQMGRQVRVQYTVVVKSDSGQVYAKAKYQLKDTITTMSKPHFIGGKAAYYKFLYENLRWPQQSKERHGAIHIAFTVEEDGSLTNVHIVKGLSPSLDAEALRVIKLSAPWVPAKVNHKAVRYYYHLHIDYHLNE